MEDVWKPIRLPNNLKETITEWLESSDGGLGVCLLCAGRIMSEDPWCWGRTGIDVHLQPEDLDDEQIVAGWLLGGVQRG